MNGSHSLYSDVVGDLRWDVTPSIPTSKTPKQEIWKKKKKSVRIPFLLLLLLFYLLKFFFIRDDYRSRRLNQIPGPGPGLGIRPYGGAELGIEDGFLRPWWFTWPDDDDDCSGGTGTGTGNDSDDDPWLAKGDTISIPIPEPPRFLTPSSPNPNPNPSSPSWLARPGWVEPGSGIGSALDPPCPSPRSSHSFPFFFLFDPFFPLRVRVPLPLEEDMARSMLIYAARPRSCFG